MLLNKSNISTRKNLLKPLKPCMSSLTIFLRSKMKWHLSKKHNMSIFILFKCPNMFLIVAQKSSDFSQIYLLYFLYIYPLDSLENDRGANT